MTTKKIDAGMVYLICEAIITIILLILYNITQDKRLGIIMIGMIYSIISFSVVSMLCSKINDKKEDEV